MESFRIAQTEPRLRGRAFEMIARCHSDRGHHDEAVPEYEKALNATSHDGASEAELRYQLAMSLAALGELGTAIGHLEAADARYPGRTDVTERLEEWRRAFRRAA